MTGFDLTAVFLTAIGLAGWINARFFRLPTATAMVLAGLGGGGLLLLAQSLWPAADAGGGLVHLIGGLDFPQTVIGYMLAFLLFAGSMQVDLVELRKQTLAVFSLATLGVLASTMVVGAGLWFAARLFSLSLPMPWAFVFGALISPTDPIAVLAAVRHGGLSKTLQTVLQGEALFNDGVGIVIFTALLAIAGGAGALHPVEVALRVAAQAIGGVALGWAMAQIVVRAIRTIDDHAVEVALTIALAAGVYSLANAIHVSGPLAAVAAGLTVGGCALQTAMSDEAQSHLRAFWTLIDENLNALLFLLLGLQMLVIPIDVRLSGVWVTAILLVLAARFVVVLPWGTYFHFRERGRGANLLLNWGGLHGALSLALALSVPKTGPHAVILSTTFAVVIFSVLAQGATFGLVAARFAARTTSEN